jgi:hypothetical protein
MLCRGSSGGWMLPFCPRSRANEALLSFTLILEDIPDTDDGRTSAVLSLSPAEGRRGFWALSFAVSGNTSLADSCFLVPLRRNLNPPIELCPDASLLEASNLRPYRLQIEGLEWFVLLLYSRRQLVLDPE